MDGKFLAHLEATRRAVERVTSGIDLWKITTAADAAQRAAVSSNLEKFASTFTYSDRVIRHYERLTDNSALVGRSLTKLIGRSSLELAKFNGADLAGVRLAPPNVTTFEILSTLLGERALELTRLNDVVSGTLTSTAFRNLRGLDLVFARRLVKLSDSYRDILGGLTTLQFPLPGFVIDLPPRDMAVKSTIVASLASDFEPTEARIDLDDPAYARADVDLMLADLDPEYVSMLDEVYETMAGNSIGRVRHILVSLRELLMHVLHDLSPDEQVIAWVPESKYLHEGRPTRVARYMFICRFVAYGSYGEYLKKSSGMTSAFFDLMNALHQVRPNVHEFQLRLLLTDALGILRFLLRAARHRP